MSSNERKKVRAESSPPDIPDIQRKPEFYRYQWIGIPLLFLVPVLALLGVFGESQASAAAEGGPLELEVTYPERFRYKMIEPLEIRVTNTGDAPLETITVHFERAYVDAFSNATFTPSAQTVTGEYYEFQLQNVPPGQTVVIAGELQAESFWRHSGYVRAATGDQEIQVDVSTLVFP